MISSEATKRDDLQCWLDGGKVGQPRIKKYKDRDDLIADIASMINKDPDSIPIFLKRTRYLFDVDVSINDIYITFELFLSFIFLIK